MAADWDVEMQEMFDRLQRALAGELRTQLTAMGAQLEERLEQRLDASETRLTGRINARLEASERRIEERLSHRLQVQAEELREIVRTAADNYGGVLESIRHDLADLRQGWQTKTADTDGVLTEHLGRIVALERATGVVRE